ncbi:O-antigen ligase family protein [Streptomyces tsukubensis]|uniref:O-antigen ligase-related domain-containing protein n=1 Tax=Streptomyces tsukubensis TaxID=83656 RepID=A0A1V4A4A5_9ACTN|nr:O-antigen ligase family protein [Streptomyces tsukubensis]OON75407.1 hypothetical protein B1H18_23090 [Streptomyces tsukubensis]QFR97901.1 hypothetical protein GBW32_20695 [Streptomyces tsukubensis]
MVTWIRAVPLGARPLLPVLAVVALLAVPPPSGGGEGGGFTVADAASALLVLFCAVRVVRSMALPLTRAAAVLFALPVLGLTVAALGARDPVLGVTGLGRYLQVFVLVPAAVLVLLRGRRDFRTVAASIVLLALYQGALGVTQYLTGTGASYMGDDVRAVGTFGAGDVMGMATVVAFGLICAVGLALDPAPGAIRLQRPIALGCALVLLLPLALSFSRGAWIATVVAVGAQLLLAGVRGAVRVLAAVTASAVVLIGGFGVGGAMLQDRASSITRVADAPDQSVTDRYSMWAAAVDMWREQPVTGVGLKGFPAHRDSYASLALSSGSDTAGAGMGFHVQALLSPHNMYLLVLSEQGLLGLTLLAGGWAALLVLGVRRLIAARRAGAGGDCGLVACGLLIWQLVDFAYGDIGGPSTVLTAVVLGLVAWWALAVGEPHGPRETASAEGRTG